MQLTYKTSIKIEPIQNEAFDHKVITVFSPAIREELDKRIAQGKTDGSRITVPDGPLAFINSLCWVSEQDANDWISFVEGVAAANEITLIIKSVDPI